MTKSFETLAFLLFLTPKTLSDKLFTQLCFYTFSNFHKNRGTIEFSCSCFFFFFPNKNFYIIVIKKKKKFLRKYNAKF